MNSWVGNNSLVPQPNERDTAEDDVNSTEELMVLMIVPFMK